ncbi:MAG: hypothetical protein JXB05_14440 [Myxococcaceae bacterium]|nr:hypothetical protein [Myxococcaceae bacterium]
MTTACAGLPPLEGVTHLRLRVTGEGLSAPIERITPVDIRPEDVPEVPPGLGRVLEVRGYTGEHTSAGWVVSVGRSRPFDMPEKGAPAEPIRVTLRRVNTFVPLESTAEPGSCLELTGPRAGHTATLLEDGRVLLAGGFRFSPEGAIETLTSVEILDPGERTVTFVENPGPEAAHRAFHTASVLMDGRVALIGGEVQGAGGPATPLSTAAVFDPMTQRVQQFALARARSRHAAAADITGRVLLVGGVGEGGGVLSELEGVEPAAGRSFSVPTPLPRVGASVVLAPGAERLVVIGGSDGSALSREVLTFAFNGSTFSPAGPSVLLRQARRDAAVAAFGDGQRLLVMGGYAGVSPEDSARPVAASELLDLGTEAPGASVGPSIVPRGELCAVSLPGGRVFTSGGRMPGLEGGLVSTGVTELLTPTENPSGGVLGMAPVEPVRYLHTCTPLPDGSVLVAGGVELLEGSAPQLARGAYLFMPVPRD